MSACKSSIYSSTFFFCVSVTCAVVCLSSPDACAIPALRAERIVKRASQHAICFLIGLSFHGRSFLLRVKRARRVRFGSLCPGGGHPDIVRGQNLRVRKLGLDPDPLQARSPSRRCPEYQVVLVVQHPL